MNSIRSKQFQNWNRKFLGEFSDNLRIIGGWVPALLYPDSEHIGKKVHYLVKKIENKRIENKRIEKSSMQRKAKDSEGSL